ncbi:heparan-alpha-glucosaminide N-acetyltransferase [Genypterus blacodes]|uniref:heparan-alpha-glucosaminide N-acetyltransferase n=1 Tax=Genypterus blacodes TaxID=154954 RepID=UPI003F76AD9F
MTGSCGGHLSSEPALKMDQAFLTFHNQLLDEEVRVFYTSDYCYKCVYQPLVSVKARNSSAHLVISTKFTLMMRLESQSRNETYCRWSQKYGEGGDYSVWIKKLEAPSNPACTHTVEIPLGFAVEDSGPKPKPTRLRSLDTFRGFALTAMVFVNYGGGGYWFFQHAPWNGLTVADLVMPWFVFIIGTSVVLAFRSMQKRGVTRLQMLRKITWRTVVLLLLGFCFLNYSPRDGPLSWSWLRVPGVLQRLGFTYFVLSLLQTFWGLVESPQREHHWWNPIQDVLLYWPQWLTIILLETLWLCLTFLMPVPNCPTGYLGPGGIGDDGLHPNCTGGAAGYIDRLMFGDNMYRWPTCRELYRTTQPFDPEGVLGTINSVVMGFMGMQAGKILITYKGENFRILGRFLVWAVVLGISAAILSKCTRDGGFIPVNKNLWSLSYVTCMGCFSFLLLGCVYFVTDVKGWWGGQPFTYPGMNSILVYVGHSLLGFYFPFSWEMRSQQTHWEWLLQSLWGTALWVLIAYLLYRKKFFLKI